MKEEMTSSQTSLEGFKACAGYTNSFTILKPEHLIQYCCWSLSTTIELHSSTLTRCVVMQVVIILPGNGALNN